MDEKEIAVKLTEHDLGIKTLTDKVDKLEAQGIAINNLALSVNKLAINMEHMYEEQKKQGCRLDKLEAEPLENAKYFTRLIIGNVISVLVGAVLGSILSLVLR